MVDVAGDRVERLDRTACSGWVDAQFCEVPNLEESGLGPDRRRTPTTELDPVPHGRIVGRGDHRSGNVPVARDEVQRVRRYLPDVENVHPLSRHAFAEGIREAGRRYPGVASESDLR
ncbi:hypothetical protein BMS3Bbin01_01128 [bacterium BMS3Bbin01]|nr:hypothetical protein BMS3Bbin01_01128 [bacterium BMS3Bbin01]